MPYLPGVNMLKKMIIKHTFSRSKWHKIDSIKLNFTVSIARLKHDDLNLISLCRQIAPFEVNYFMQRVAKSMIHCTTLKLDYENWKWNFIVNQFNCYYDSYQVDCEGRTMKQISAAPNKR